jgi:hypothetical protein
MNITIDGMAELQKKMTEMTREFSGMESRDMQSAMKRSLYILIFAMAKYPKYPKDAVTKSRRTGTLGRKWTDDIDITQGGMRGKIGNNAEYGPWVQSNRFQTDRHRRTGWITDQQALEQNEAAIRREFETAVRRMMER